MFAIATCWVAPPPCPKAPSSANCVWTLRVPGADYDDRTCQAESCDNLNNNAGSQDVRPHVCSTMPLSPQPHCGIVHTHKIHARRNLSHALRNQNCIKNRIVYNHTTLSDTRYLLFLFQFFWGGYSHSFFLCAFFFCSQRPSASSLAVASGTMKCTTARQTVRCHAPCLTQKATTTTSVRPAANTPTSPPVASSKAAR